MSNIEMVFLIDNSKLTLKVHEIMILYSCFATKVEAFEYAGDALSRLTELCLANRDFPDIIFLDLNMPLMDGWKFLDEFEKLDCLQKHAVRIFILSSTLEAEDINRAKSHPWVADFIPKPLTEDALSSISKNP